MSHVFVSYVRDDAALVDRMVQGLEAAGIEVWLDRREIRPGSRWQDAIAEAIAEGAFFVACFSSAYGDRTRTHMNEELTLAIEELRRRPTDRAWFVPVLLDDSDVPDRRIGAGAQLSDIQWVSLAEDWAGGLAALIGTILTEQFGEAGPEKARAWRRAKRLAEQLGDKASSWDDKLYAARELAQSTHADLAVPALRGALHEASRELQLAAVRGLANHGPVAAEALASGVDGESDIVRREICRALLEIRELPGTLVQPLVNALEHDDDGRSPTPGDVLAGMGELAVDALLRAVDSGRPGVAARAAAALCAMEPLPVRIADGMVARLGHPDSLVRRAAARVVDCLIHATDVDWDRAAVPLAELIADATTRGYAYHALTKLRARAHGAIPTLIAMLRSRKDDLRSQFSNHETAARVLIAIGAPAIPALTTLALDRSDLDDDEEMARRHQARDTALWALGVLLARTGDSRAEACLLDVANSAADHIQLRVQAASSLAACGITNGDLLDVLIDGVDPDRTGWPSRSAASIEALTHYGDRAERLMPVLTTYARSAAHEVVRNAAAAAIRRLAAETNGVEPA